MGKKLNLNQKGISSLFIYLAVTLLLLGACTTPPAKQVTSQEAMVPVIEQIKVTPSPLRTVVEIMNSRSAPYTAFKLTDPPRIILDIRGKPGTSLPPTTKVDDENVNEIIFEEGKTQTMTTRMTVTLARSLDYKVLSSDNTILLTLTPKQVEPPTEKKGDLKVSSADVKKEPAEAQYTPAEPRVLFEPRPTNLNQVLGIDFTMLDHGKSRLMVTTDKKVRYDLDRKGPITLIMKLSETTIPPLLLKEIDTSHFPGALDRIKPTLSPAKKLVSLTISLKEMVPFHVKQTDKGLSIDFGRTSIRPPEKKIIPLQFAKAQAQARPPEQVPGSKEMETKQPPKKYTGEPMYLDFINADVTHILRLINDVSKDNIIWDPAIKGKKVSMILKDVPWDEALELIMVNNDLAKRRVGTNIWWITTKQKAAQLEAEERKEKALEEKERKSLEEESKKAEKEAKMEAEEDVELKTEYIQVNFSKADEIKQYIVLSELGKKKGGKVNVDVVTNRIIITDISKFIDDAKKLVKQIDKPKKQIMIEARIVDASSSFGRDLGLQWRNIGGAGGGAEYQGRKTDSMGWVTGPGWVSGNADLTAGHEQRSAGTFTTNAPDGWGPNIGLSFARLSGNLLHGLALDASLALAESEGKAKVMSAPKVITTEGTSASISSGEQIILPATENVASTTLDATLSLTVTPTAVSFNDFVTLQIAVTDDTAPSLQRKLTKNINTNLMIKSGDTVVIGGILKESEGVDVSGIPVLKDIPGLGWLFKAQKKNISKSELLIFITPTVLPPPT